MKNSKNPWRLTWIVLLGFSIVLMVLGAAQSGRYDDVQKQVNSSAEHSSLRYVYEQQAILYRAYHGASSDATERLNNREKELKAELERKFPGYATMSSGFLLKAVSVFLILVSVLGIMLTPNPS